MSNLEKYNEAFIEVFGVTAEELNAQFSSDNVESWDSVKQLTLTTSVEDAFDIMLDPEDIMGFKSYEAGKKILDKYEIEIA